jgi:hypothetical protein
MRSRHTIPRGLPAGTPHLRVEAIGAVRRAVARAAEDGSVGAQQIQHRVGGRERPRGESPRSAGRSPTTGPTTGRRRARRPRGGGARALARRRGTPGRLPADRRGVVLGVGEQQRDLEGAPTGRCERVRHLVERGAGEVDERAERESRRGLRASMSQDAMAVRLRLLDRRVPQRRRADPGSPDITSAAGRCAAHATNSSIAANSASRPTTDLPRGMAHSARPERFLNLRSGDGVLRRGNGDGCAPVAVARGPARWLHRRCCFCVGRREPAHSGPRTRRRVACRSAQPTLRYPLCAASPVSGTIRLN